MANALLRRPIWLTNTSVPRCWRICDWNFVSWTSKGQGIYSGNKCGARDKYLCGLCTPTVHNAWHPNTQRSPTRGFNKFRSGFSVNRFVNKKWARRGDRDGLKRLQDVIKNKTKMVTGQITELMWRRVPTREPMYNWSLTQVNHRYPTRQRGQMNNVESNTIVFEDTCVPFNPHSIARPKRLEREPLKRVAFAYHLVKNEWLRSTYRNEHLLFHSQDNEYDARDTQPTCCDYLQYKMEECQSFIDLCHTMMRYAQTKHKVDALLTPTLLTK